MKQYKSILLADSSQSRNILSSRLRMNEFKVEMAIGGFQAINMVEQGDFDLVIVRGNMGDMPAIEVVGLIRTKWEKENLPIIYIHDPINEDEQKEIIQFGANACIQGISDFRSILDAVSILTKS